MDSAEAVLVGESGCVATDQNRGFAGERAGFSGASFGTTASDFSTGMGATDFSAGTSGATVSGTTGSGVTGAGGAAAGAGAAGRGSAEILFSSTETCSADGTLAARLGDSSGSAVASETTVSGVDGA